MYRNFRHVYAKGDAIEYRIDKPSFAAYADGAAPPTSKIRPLYNTIESDEIVLEAERDANNIITAVVRHRIERIGVIRELVKGTNTTLDDVIDNCNSDIIRVPQNEPDAFADGVDGNANGDIGRLQVLAEIGAVHSVKNNFDRLLRYAQELKVTLGYAPVVIDCVNLAHDDIFIGEIVRGMRRRKNDSDVKVVFVMRLITKLGVFYLFDCKKIGSQTSGIIIRVKEKNAFTEESIRQVLGQLFSGNGRLSDVSAISEFGIVRYFKHTNGDYINWVKQAIGNCLKKK